MRAYKKPGRPPCYIDGCERPTYCKGMCVMHYSRHRSGNEATSRPEPIRRPPGTGSITSDGYIVLTGSTHPLATAQGKVPQHRAVLYDHIGPGEHPCHWCAKPLTWRGEATSKINVDHLDENRVNNAPANLVPSCLDCNTKRSSKPRKRAEPKPRVYTEVERQRARERSRAYYRANRERILAKLREKNRREDVA